MVAQLPWQVKIVQGQLKICTSRIVIEVHYLGKQLKILVLNIA